MMMDDGQFFGVDFVFDGVLYCGGRRLVFGGNV